MRFSSSTFKIVFASVPFRSFQVLRCYRGRAMPLDHMPHIGAACFSSILARKLNHFPLQRVQPPPQRFYAYRCLRASNPFENRIKNKAPLWRRVVSAVVKNRLSDLAGFCLEMAAQHGRLSTDPNGTL